MGWCLLGINGDLTIGQLIAFRIISGYVVGPLINLATSWQTFQGVALSIERSSDVVDAEAEGSENELDQLPLPPVAGEVTFQSVDFRFGEGAPWWLGTSVSRFHQGLLLALLAEVAVVRARS